MTYAAAMATLDHLAHFSGLGIEPTPLQRTEQLQSVFFFFCIFRATPTVYGVSQARDLIGTTPAGLFQSHSYARSELRLRPTPQLMAAPDP